MKIKVSLIKLGTYLTVMLLLVSTLPADAWRLYSYRWRCEDVSYLGWYVDSNAQYRNYIITQLAAADDHWNGVVQQLPTTIPRFYMQTYRPWEYAVIFIHTYSAPDNVLAGTEVTTSGVYVLIADVYINTYYITTGHYDSVYHFREVLNHELGHVLGLAHETDYGPTVLMYPDDSPWVENSIWTPQGDDIWGVIERYGSHICG